MGTVGRLPVAATVAGSVARGRVPFGGAALVPIPGPRPAEAIWGRGAVLVDDRGQDQGKGEQAKRVDEDASLMALIEEREEQPADRERQEPCGEREKSRSRVCCQ